MQKLSNEGSILSLCFEHSIFNALRFKDSHKLWKGKRKRCKALWHYRDITLQ